MNTELWIGYFIGVVVILLVGLGYAVYKAKDYKYDIWTANNRISMEENLRRNIENIHEDSVREYSIRIKTDADRIEGLKKDLQKAKNEVSSYYDDLCLLQKEYEILKKDFIKADFELSELTDNSAGGWPLHTYTNLSPGTYKIETVIHFT